MAAAHGGLPLTHERLELLNLGQVGVALLLLLLLLKLVGCRRWWWWCVESAGQAGQGVVMAAAQPVKACWQHASGQEALNTPDLFLRCSGAAPGVWRPSGGSPEMPPSMVKRMASLVKFCSLSFSSLVAASPCAGVSVVGGYGRAERTCMAGSMRGQGNDRCLT